MTTKSRQPLPAAAYARLVLVLAGTVWLAVGVPGLLDPKWLADLADIELPNTMALYEFRAQWGGLSLAIALLHYIASTRSRYLVPGLLATLALDVGLSSGRVTSLVLDPGLPGAVGFALLAAELVLMALVGIALWRIGKLTLEQRKALRAEQDDQSTSDQSAPPPADH